VHSAAWNGEALEGVGQLRERVRKRVSEGLWLGLLGHNLFGGGPYNMPAS
jgi:hypothetical protein